jgi:hypothetical protein
MPQQRNLTIKQEESVIAALAKLAPDSNLPVGGKSSASKDLQAQLQAHVDTMNSLSDAHATLAQLVAQEKSQQAALIPVVTGIRNYAAGQYGEKSPAFSSFGFTPRKETTRTVATKASAVEKVRATRIARHTMGSRQRAAIHGVVPTTPPSSGPVVTTPTTAAPVVAQPVNPPVVATPVLPTPIATPPVNSGANGAVMTSAVVNGAAH